mgnify:CR=1 FL=1
MTDKRRREIARRLRFLLDQGLHRKDALLAVRMQFGTKDKLLAQSSVYKYCKMMGVSTK